MDDVQAAILRQLPREGTVEFAQLHSDVARSLGMPITVDDFELALAELAELLEIAREGKRVGRREPDFPERELEKGTSE